MSIPRVRWGLLFIFALICLAACVPPAPRPDWSPISPLGTAGSQSALLTNFLSNGGFEGGHYQPKGETALVLPMGWKAWALDEKGVLKLYEPAGMRVLGQYRDLQYGLRPGQESYVLKPEVLHICRVKPYLDPPRIFEGECSVTGFKLYGHLTFGIQQTFATIPGHVYTFSGSAHGWSRMAEDPNDAHFSHGVGTSAFYAEEGEPLLNDSNDNFRFRLCVDSFGAENVFGSAVTCGKAAIIYNAFHSMPSITFMARADSATVFWSVDTRFGMVNSNAFGDSFSVVDITPPPTVTPTVTSTPGPTATAGPTVTPSPGISITCQLSMTQRVMILLPPGYGPEWYVAAAPVVAQKGWSIGSSAVDACVNSCSNRVVIAVNAQERGCNLCPACRAPCGSLQYIPLSATLDNFADLLDRYPEWMREAWGICIPAVMRP